MRSINQKLFILILVITLFSCNQPDSFDSLYESLKVEFSGPRAQIEVGGPYVGIEMHNSSPLLNRISFYYPRANSIDLNEDYWNREKYHISFLGLKIGDGRKKWIGLKPFKFDLTPYSVSFTKSDDEKAIDIQYHFCKDKPAMVAQIDITNKSEKAEIFELYTHLEATVKTSHTYNHKKAGWTEYDESGATVYVNFDDDETGNAQIFVANAGELPQSFTTKNTNSGIPFDNDGWWMNNASALPGKIISRDKPDHPVAAYIYQKNLQPGQKLSIVQIIGSCQQNEGEQLVPYLLQNYQQEVEKYEHYVLNNAFQNNALKTGDPIIDHSVHWAKAILSTNAHYLDGQIVPMPCPAEYNFYFTHDALLTGLAAVNFDLNRVKNDLLYIINHANEQHVIPHAYYWKDNRYLTEYAESDNWNHFWFIQLAASYLRHTNDVETLTTLYPFLLTSVHETLKNKRDDDLFYAYRPDWWDIGRSTGPRAYMTIMAIRALRDFVYVSTALDEGVDELPELEAIADRMQQQLTERLWDDDLKYLISYFADGSMDRHIYIGSLLAAHFGVLDSERTQQLVRTATDKLLDEKIGIYNVVPMDFHELIAYLKFSGNEAGEPGYYANGGVWPHGNALYALALMSVGKKEQAFKFIKSVMTVDGVINSPNGQPAMYEYRTSDINNPQAYGKVDKPQFLWAGGWYLYSLYHLFAIDENVWNVSLAPWLPERQQQAQLTLTVNGKPILVNITGSGPYIKQMQIDGRDLLTLVIPTTVRVENRIDVELGRPQQPYLAATNSMLVSSAFDKSKKRLTLQFQAFPGHENEISVISPEKANRILQNGAELQQDIELSSDNDIYRSYFSIIHQQNIDTVIIVF